MTRKIPHHLLLFYLIAAIAALPVLYAQELQVAWNGKELRVTAPQLHFLSGKVLDRIRNGNAVPFDFQLSLASGAQVVKRTAERFVISYDLWEERFSVTRLGRDRGQRKAASHLSQNAAEVWCLANLPLPTEGVDAARPVVVHLEIRAEDARDTPPVIGEPGISLAALIEVFSRPSRTQQPKWNLQRGPLRLSGIQ